LESAKYFQAFVIMLGAGATLLAGQHVRVDIFHTRMTEFGKSRVDLFGFYLLMAPACLLLIWNAQSFVRTGIRGVFILKTLIPIFAVTMLVQGFSIALRAAMCICGQIRPERPKGVPPFFQTGSEEIL